MYAHETHAYEVYPYEIHTREMHAYEPPAHEMHTREMYSCDIYAYRSVAFFGDMAVRVLQRGAPNRGVYARQPRRRRPASSNTMSTPSLTADRMQPFYLVVRTYLRLLVIAGLVSRFSFWR